MEQRTVQTSPTPLPPKKSKIAVEISLKNILTGVFIGVLIGISGILFYQGHFPQIIHAFYTASWAVFGFLIFSFLLLLGFKSYITKFIFGSKAENLTDVLEDTQRISEVITDRLADRLLADLSIEERGKIKTILPRLANWFFWGRLRNWWWQWILGIFVSLGGITGTVLLMNQNELLNNQNDLIKRQMSLEEASRRGALIMLMSNLMDKVDKEIETQQIGLSLQARDTTRFRLSQSLIGQIAALSHSFKPYRYMDVTTDTLMSKPLSPEKGHLLKTLVQLPLDTITFNKIYKLSSFQSASLMGADLKNSYLVGIDLTYSDLTGADLGGANLNHALLWSSDLSNAGLRWANLKSAKFHAAILNNTNFFAADVDSAIFSGADLRGSSFIRASCKGTYFGEAYLNKTNFQYADVIEAEFTATDLSDSNLKNAKFNGSSFSSSDLSRSNFEGSDLSDAIFKWTNMTQVNLAQSNLCETELTIKQLQKCSSLYESKGLDEEMEKALRTMSPHLFLSPKQ